jgi:hypothetical protein
MGKQPLGAALAQQFQKLVDRGDKPALIRANMRGQQPPMRGNHFGEANQLRGVRPGTRRIDQADRKAVRALTQLGVEQGGHGFALVGGCRPLFPAKTASRNGP